MVRRTPGLLDASRPNRQTHATDQAVPQRRKLPSLVAILPRGEHRKAACLALGYTENSFRLFSPLRPEIRLLRPIRAHEAENDTLRGNLFRLARRASIRQWFAIVHGDRKLSGAARNCQLSPRHAPGGAAFLEQPHGHSAVPLTAMREGGETFIHRATGPIRDRNSYGNDPFPPRG